MSVPPSLRTPGLAALWARARERLERRDLYSRGRVALPELSSQERLALQALLDRRLKASVDLDALEAAFRRIGIADKLPAALAALGHPVSSERAERRAERSERRSAHAAARAVASTWPVPWSAAWIDTVIQAGILRGFDAVQASVFLDDVRRVLEELERGASTRRSRVELAARLLGSAHALDPGTRLAAAVEHALRSRSGLEKSTAGRELWEHVGVHLDLTSAPVLTWGLPLLARCELAPLTSAASRAGIPVHLSRFALEQHPAIVAPQTRLLVAENPRVVEAAAQLRARFAVVSTNGQPSSTVLLLIEQLIQSRARLLYHGDFDSAGLAICERMTTLGLTPWCMSADDYRAALEAADAEGSRLPIDEIAPGPTSWDPALRTLFDKQRRIVHEERLLPELIEANLD